MNDGAVVLFSGGQDSTTCLAWAIRMWGAGNVVALTITYGQRHVVEVEAARKIGKIAGVEHIFAEVSGFPSNNALIDHAAEFVTANGLPSTFVPCRNAVFMALAGAHATARGWGNVVSGVCQADYSGYPDCRQDFVDAMATALGKAVDGVVTIHAPLMWLSKGEAVLLMGKLGALDLLGESVTCYRGQPSCGECPACVLRASGFKEAGVLDPAEEKP
uniref:7-cyano-7-deazaguanine synthase n=1 Tax=viral metagenome TaxID=1070528 RepID=A0A6M3KTH6_9ZZZZ